MLFVYICYVVISVASGYRFSSQCFNKFDKPCVICCRWFDVIDIFFDVFGVIFPVCLVKIPSRQIWFFNSGKGYTYVLYYWPVLTFWEFVQYCAFVF